MPYDPSEPSPIPRLPDTSWPTDNQLSGIGAVAATWSWLEMALEALLCTLSQGDEALTQALTGDLSADNRIKALKRLATTWERLLAARDHDFAPLLAEVNSIAKWLAANKARRNQIVHTIWLRDTDAKMFGWKHHTMPLAAADFSGRHINLTRADALKFSREIGSVVGRLYAAELAARALPVLQDTSPDMPPLPGLASLLAPHRIRRVP